MSDIRCPHCQQMVNKKCWNCGWERGEWSADPDVCPDPKCKFGVTERVYYDHDGDPDWEQDLCDWPGHGIVLHPTLQPIRRRDGHWHPKGWVPGMAKDFEALLDAFGAAMNHPFRAYLHTSHEPEN